MKDSKSAAITSRPPFTIRFMPSIIYATDSRPNDFGKTHSMCGKVRARAPERESMRAFAAKPFQRDNAIGEDEG